MVKVAGEKLKKSEIDNSSAAVVLINKAELEKKKLVYHAKRDHHLQKVILDDALMQSFYAKINHGFILTDEFKFAIGKIKNFKELRSLKLEVRKDKVGD